MICICFLFYTIHYLCVPFFFALTISEYFKHGFSTIEMKNPNLNRKDKYVDNNFVLSEYPVMV